VRGAAPREKRESRREKRIYRKPRKRERVTSRKRAGRQR